MWIEGPEVNLEAPSLELLWSELAGDIPGRLSDSARVT
jgi:hypothetical protein